MKHLLIRMLISSVAVLAVAKLLPGIEVYNLSALLITVVLLGILNAILRPIMVVLTLPVTLITFGFFIFIINGIILYLISLLVDGFEISSVFVAVIASILITIVSGIINWLGKD